MEKNLKLVEDAREPPTELAKDEIRVRVLAMSINPVDYKVAEIPVVGSTVIGYPASPGMDFCAKVLSLGGAVDSVAVGDTVLGKLDKPSKFGSLGEIMVVPERVVVTKPKSVSNEDAATLGVCGLTAYQSIVPFTKPGQSVFINGGSGGVGTFAIQIAKAAGLHVTTSCSTPNVQLCKELGADEVIDYKAAPLTGVLTMKGQVYDLIADNVGVPADLYKACHHFLKPSGRYVQVGGEPSQAMNIMSRALQPSFLGGGKRPWQFVSVQIKQPGLRQVADWMADGKVKAVVQKVYPFQEAPEAYVVSKTGRTKGKLVVKVNEE